MKLNVLSRVLLILMLGILLGGTLALGMCVAPTLFKTLPVAQAGLGMTRIFQRFDMIQLLLAMGVVLVQLVLMGWSWKQKHPIRWAWVQRVLAVVLLVMVGYTHWVLLPKIEHFRSQGIIRGVGQKGQAFDITHHQTEAIFKAQAGVEAVLLIVTAVIL